MEDRKETRLERAASLRDTVESAGWKTIIEPWLKQREELIVTQIREQLHNLKSTEKEKWITIYSGQSIILKEFNDMLERELDTRTFKDKVIGKIDPAAKYFDQ